jgi:hypothetical protein
MGAELVNIAITFLIMKRIYNFQVPSKYDSRIYLLFHLTLNYAIFKLGGRLVYYR